MSHQPIVEFVERAVSAMGLALKATVETTPDGVRINLEGEDGEVLLRRKGEGLQALQHIVKMAFRRQLGDEHRVVVDCLGFRKDKDAELRQMARFLADKVKRTKIQEEIGPLNPYERRIVHLAVAEDSAVVSESIGDALMKTVIISVRK